MTTLTANGLNHKTGDGSIQTESTPSRDQKAESITSNSNDELKSSSNYSVNYTPLTNDSNSDESSLNNDSQKIIDSLQLIKDLDLFLVTAPVNWHENQVIRRYFLNKEEGFVSCVYWNNLYFITGTDIVRCIAYKMSHIGREIVDRKKFEEGIFSDLRALKCGTHALLENSRSPFLKFLHRNQCLRTQKKQKVFFWFSVPHNKLFTDVLERDLKREVTNQQATTKAVNDAFKAFKYDQSLPLLEQLSPHFSNYLGKDVSSLILKTDNILPTLDTTTTNITPKSNINSIQQFPDHVNSYTDPHNNNINSNPHDNVVNKNNNNNHNNNNNSQFSADFPLDFLDSADSLLQENYTTSISSINCGLKSANKYYPNQALFSNQAIISPRNNSQFQVFQQLQQQSQPASFQDQIDGYVLNALNQPLLSASYFQQQLATQPMYILSGLPSAIDPTNSLLKNHAQDKNPSISLNQSQTLSLPMQQTPSTYVINNENHIPLDPMLLSNNDLNSQNIQFFSQFIRSQSPSISSNTGSYFNLPSSGLIPISMPLATSNMKTFSQHDILAKQKDDLQQIDNSLAEANKDSFETNNTENSSERRLEPKESIDDKIEVAKETSRIIQPSQQRQDYMMPSMPSDTINRLTHINFGIADGQLFTPNSLGIEYNVDMNAGVGFSPVIGFNNGLLSAIQYQPKHNLTVPKSASFEGDNSSSNKNEKVDKTMDNDKNTEKKLKGILQNNGVSKITKHTNSKIRPRRTFLNPTLQHLQLDSLLDENGSFSDDDDDGIAAKEVNHDEAMKQEYINDNQ
jgi:hypothetical protein